MADCFEAVMAAVFLDGGLPEAGRVFSHALWSGEDPSLMQVWNNLPPHPLQADEVDGDRHWVQNSPILKKLEKFEETTGIEYNHIRMLAKAFTLRNVAYNNLTMGNNERLEFLGDTILQLITSEFLFKHFPTHHEGHLSLLRSSLVNNRTQAQVCDALGMCDYVITSEKRKHEKLDMKTKEKADLMEAFLGALYVDKNLLHCKVFCNVCFFPRLKEIIVNQDWNDPKSQLQQCCLTLRELEGEDPSIPVYKVLECTGPTNTRTHTVAVYFKGERLATGIGSSIQKAEMKAAINALHNKAYMFPHLTVQRRFSDKKGATPRKKKPRGNKNTPEVTPSKEAEVVTPEGAAKNKGNVTPLDADSSQENSEGKKLIRYMYKHPRHWGKEGKKLIQAMDCFLKQGGS